MAILAAGIVIGYDWQSDLRFKVRLDLYSYTSENSASGVLTEETFSAEDPEGLVNAAIYAFVAAYIVIPVDIGGWGLTFSPPGDSIAIINPYRKAPASVALSNNFSAAWNMPEDTGTPRADSARTNHLTEVGTVGREATPDGSWAAAFDGDPSNYLTISSPDLVSGDFDFCIRLDLKYGNIGGDHPIFSSWSAANTREVFELWWNELSGCLELRVHNGTTVDIYPTTLVVDGGGFVETFIVLWHEAATNTVHIQVNASTVQSFVLTAPMPSDSDTFDIGLSRAAMTGLYGWIRRFGYGRFLPSAADRAIMYNAGLGQDWPFEELAIVPMPSGTGFTYNMNGVQASAAKLVDVLYDTESWTGDAVLGHLGGSLGQLVQVSATQLLDTLATAAIDNKIPIRVAGVWVGGTLSDIINQSGISTADGDMLVRGSAGIWTVVPKGLAGQVLTMNAGGTLPEWQ